MILDLDNKTVTFPGYTKLTLDQLWAVIELMDVELSFTEDDPGFVPNGYEARRVYLVASFTAPGKSYAVVQFDNGEWACSCLDWLHRRSESFDMCKHIFRLAWLCIPPGGLHILS